MKWEKFLKLINKHPFIEQDLRHKKNISPTTKEFVKKKVGFIAFRPFESLDLSSRSSSGASAVEYQLAFRVEGEYDKVRLRDVGTNSIQFHIDLIMLWAETCEDFLGKQLIWERIVKRTVRGSVNTGLLTGMDLEIYLFPRFYRFRPMPRPPSRRADPSIIAYMNGEPLPPIIPGTVRFVGDFD